MSQSDYLAYKAAAVVLKQVSKLPPVLASGNYISYKTFDLENKISNSKIVYSKLIPSGYKRIFDMDKKTESCTEFIICTDTNTRANRELLTSPYIDPKPLRPLVIKMRAKTITELYRICPCVPELLT